MRFAALLLLVVVVVAACGDDTAAEGTEQPTTSVPASTPIDPATSTTEASRSTSSTMAADPSGDPEVVALDLPWHRDSRGAEDAAAAVDEFVEFVGFEQPVELSGIPIAGATEGRVEIRPLWDGLAVDREAPPSSFAWSPTIAVVALTGDGRWVVTGATSPAIVVDDPWMARAVAPPMYVRFTHKLGNSAEVVASLWSSEAADMVDSAVVNSGSGVFASGSFDAVMTWPEDLRGPAILMVESRSRSSTNAVTTISIELADTTAASDRPLPPTVLGPVGDQRVDIEYQPGVRLTLHEPGQCEDDRWPVIVTGGPSRTSFADGFSERGYLVAVVDWRTPGYSAPTLSADSLSAISFAVNDLSVAVRWLRAHAEELCLDADKVVAMGFSFGGITSLSLAYTEGELEPGSVVTVDPLGPPAELRSVPTVVPPGLEIYSEEPDAAVSFGGFALADSIEAGEPPSMLVHGRNDATVPIALAEQTCAAASAVGVVCELVAHDAGHGVPPDTFDSVDDFIGRVLGDIEAD